MKEIFDDLKNTIWKDDRTLGYRQIASEHGFRIVERERFGSQAIRLKTFKLFEGKRGKRLKGVLYKVEKNTSLKTRIYDYVYFGDSKTRTNTVFEFYLPQWNFSEILIRPKGTFNKVKDFFSNSAVLFEEVVQFHKKYQIYSPTPELVRYELNEEFLDLLAEQNKIWVEAKGSFVIFYFKHKALPLDQIMVQNEYILDLLDCLLHGHSSEEYV